MPSVQDGRQNLQRGKKKIFDEGQRLIKRVVQLRRRRRDTSLYCQTGRLGGRNRFATCVIIAIIIM